MKTTTTTTTKQNKHLFWLFALIEFESDVLAYANEKEIATGFTCLIDKEIQVFEIQHFSFTKIVFLPNQTRLRSAPKRKQKRKQNIKCKKCH